MTANVYQQILDIDITEASGVRALVKGDPSKKTEGHVRVHESTGTSQAKNLFQNVEIPAHKLKSYKLAEALFDNYDLLSSVADDITPEEDKEVEDLLQFVIAQAPMKLARDYIASRTGRVLSDEAWYAKVRETWFRPFAVGSSPTRSGFEHVFLGEWKSGGNSVGGLHWWYFYYTKMDSIEYRGAIYDNTQEGFIIPEIATMSFSWEVGGQKLFKRIGGFLVGPSVEGLMAMGMVRASDDAAAPNVAVLEGAEIEFRMFKSEDRRSVNTFFPVFKRVLMGTTAQRTIVDEPDVTTTTVPAREPVRVTVPGGGKVEESTGGVRIIGALVNPEGDDAGRESVTLMNLFGKESVNLKGWRIVAPNKSFMEFGDVELVSGESMTFQFPARGPVQLSNRGGTISLLDGAGNTVQSVVYEREVARVQGLVLMWDRARKLINPAIV